MSENPLPESILQFGAGRFLRAFVDRFVQEANDAGQQVGRVVVVQSTPGSRAEVLGKSAGFHVVVRGYDDGELIDRAENVRSISRAVVAGTAWGEVLTLARSPALKYIVSNATEAGYALDDADRVDAAPPASLPGKLTQVLWQRFQAGAAPVVLLPCELIERNADKLRELCLAQSRLWALPAEFSAWLADLPWLNNLVDCIVTPGPADHPLAESDPALISAEPYRLWAIERPAAGVPALFTHPAIRLVDDLAPFYLRKVRILNGTHSAMAAKFQPAGFETVGQVLDDSDARRWVRDLMFEEIVPTLAYRLEGVAEFADQTFDRLRNPFLKHRLSDILLNHAAKVAVRLAPTRTEYEALFSRPPKKLSEAMQAT